MSSNISVELLTGEQWQRLRKIRLDSLRESPNAFGGQLEVESAFDEEQWRNKCTTLDYLLASIDGVDIALMSVQVLDGDHGATCWIGGCWSNPQYRGRGSFRSLFKYVDEHAVGKGWQRQGLGVWADNYSAIAAYNALGFIDAGHKQESQRHSGR
ncbi:MAG: GNAT family N-acetyltransferase, partial [Actinobacteria bacterium]|nr:GNAT family N-acetyltransferase [Actinomycetota bacterium]